MQKNSNGTYDHMSVTLSSLTLSDPTGKTQYSQSNLTILAVIDTGAPFTWLPDNIARDINTGVGAINDPQYGLVVPCSLANSPDVFTFGLGGAGGPTINVSFSQFVIPIINNDGTRPTFGKGAGTICLWGVASSGDDTRPILLGDPFIRSAYTVFDLTNHQISLAQTIFNVTDSNVNEIPNATVTATLAANPPKVTGPPNQAYLSSQTTNVPTGAGASAGPGTPTFALGVKVSAGAVVLPLSVYYAFTATGCTILLSMILW